MMDMDFTFDDSPLEDLLSTLAPDAVLPAGQLLTALEGEEEELLEDAFDRLEELRVTVSLSDLPKPSFTGETATRLTLEEKLAREGELLGALDADDPLQIYLEELAGIPAFGDLTLLAEDLAAANAAGEEGSALMTALLNLSMNRVVDLAREYTGWGVLLLDLLQEGSMGLWSCIAGFRGGDFEARRDFAIRHTMVRAVILQARASGVGQRMRQLMEDYRTVDERLLTELGRNPTLEEIAEAMHVTLEVAAGAAENLENARLLSRARQEPMPVEEEEDQAVEDTAYFQMRQRISELLSSLNESQATLLTLRYGLEGGLPMTAQQVAVRLGMTTDEVVSAEAAALSQLREER